MKRDPVGSTIARRFAEGDGLDLYVALVEHPVALLKDLPDHVTDHLLDAIDKDVLSKFSKKLFP
ncbi:hypothetical protein D3C72_2517380 [compost metagenome]